MGALLYSLIAGARGFIRWLFGSEKEKTKESTEDVSAPSTEDLQKIRFRARIAIIDDDEVPFVRMLSQNGYNIHHYTDLEDVDEFIRKKYHVVLLDIHGVGGTLAEKSEGWGILRYLKQQCPHLVVVIYSGGQWTMTKHLEEISLADDFLDKDAEFLDFKFKLDENVRKAFSASYHIAIQRKLIRTEIEDIESYLAIYDIIKQKPTDKEGTIRKVRKITKNERVLRYLEDYLLIISDIL